MPLMRAHAKTSPSGRAARGFTLIELIMVMIITGIIAAAVAVFMQKPIEGYFESARRAALSDVADNALRRIARELQAALPNSARTTVSGADSFIELLPVRSGGRYRASGDGGTNALDISDTADRDFDVLGPEVSVVAGDSIVIYNTGQSGANAYAGDNRRAFSSGTPGPGTYNSITFAGAQQFPRHSETYRFDVISTPVSYACDSATQTLWRYSGYAIQPTQPGSIATLDGLAGVIKAALATNVICAADAGNIGTGFEVRNADGLIALRIQLRDASNETLSLYREVHVHNAP
jgi:MSHA biogenesis protein MshO